MMNETKVVVVVVVVVMDGCLNGLKGGMDV
jgi:hypothetical protein